MPSLFGTAGAALAGGAPTGGVAGLPAATSAEGLTRTNSTDARTSLFGAAPTSTGQLPASSAQGADDGGNKPGGSGLARGSLFGSSSGGLLGSAGSSSSVSLLSGQNAFTSNLSASGGGLFGTAGSKPFSLLTTGSNSNATANTTSAGSLFGAPSHTSATRSDSLFNTSSSLITSVPNASIFGTGKGAEAGKPPSSGALFGSGRDHGTQGGTSQSGTAPQGGNPVALTGDKSKSSVPSSATDAKTGFLSTLSGGLFGSTGTAPPTLGTSGLSDATKTSGGAAESGTSTATRLPDAGDASASNETTGVGGGVSGAAAPASSCTRPAGNSDGGLLGKSGLPAGSSAAQTYERDHGQNVRSTNTLGSALQSDSALPCSGADILRRPREAALETLQHELLEEVLAKWERRLDRRVEQFIAVAEEVDSVEKAMIEESRKIQQLMNEQAKLERKQVYTAGVIDSLEHQQQGLMTLLRSIESAVLELRSGGPGETVFAGKDTTYSRTAAGGRTADAGALYPLLRGKAAGEVGGSSGPSDALGEPGSSTGPSGKSFADQSALATSMPLLSSAEQLALERLRNFDEQLAEVGRNLSYAAETFQAGPLGAIAQVLAVHQAALRAAAHQATNIEERMHQLQEAWEVSKGRPGSEGGFLKQSG